MEVSQGMSFLNSGLEISAWGPGVTDCIYSRRASPRGLNAELHGSIYSANIIVSESYLMAN